MKSLLNALLICLGITAILIASGCGTDTSDPTMPETNSSQEAITNSTQDGHGILGVYDLLFDPETLDLSIAEARGVDTHYDISTYIAPHATASLISWDPITRILEFKLYLTNPSLIDVFDVRTLFLADASTGFEMLNPDDYTELFNPFAAGTINPFRAYAKLAMHREFGAGATYDEPFKIQCPPAWGAPAKFLVECSWPGNCEDPYEISNQTISNPINPLTPGTISLDAYDHQNNISQVRVDTSLVTGGITWLTNTGGTTWEANIVPGAAVAPGVYRCWIAAENVADPWDLYDFLDIVVVPIVTIPDWNDTDYPINGGGCTYDLGVIADPGGPRDSNILMVDQTTTDCSKIIKYDAYYTGWSNYQDLVNLDPAIPNYQPYPVTRIDAANDGAFSFTNKNDLPFPFDDSDLHNYNIWSVFDNLPQLHLGPSPDEGRYYFDTMHLWDAETRPIDVCDDFGLGQYAIFSTEVLWTPRDILVIGTMPDSYTHDKVRYFGNLDVWAGPGCGDVNPSGIRAIDSYEVIDDAGDNKAARVYILEEFGGSWQVEVFDVFDTMPAWFEDFVNFYMTINIAIPGTPVEEIVAHDIELLPRNNLYAPNTMNPNLCVLVSYVMGGVTHGEVLIYDAVTGMQVDAIGDLVDPALPKSTVYYLDTDDDNWEVHVSNMTEDGDTQVTVFDYS
jgi:hypothetical protein